MRSRNEAQDWANKRKAAVERAALLREQRKTGANSNEEQPTFTPQINKRPSYLKQDSLDKLTDNFSRDPDDPFEQPLPGARGAQAAMSEYGIPTVPSPGSDALGREMKRYPSGSNVPATQPPPAGGPYKSKFLQQYGNEQVTETDSGSYGRQYQQQQQQQQPVNARTTHDTVHKTPVKAQEDADEVFMSTLRSGGSGKKAAAHSSNGPGWNDDVSSGGFGAPPKLKTAATTKSTRSRVAQPTDEQDGYGARHNRLATHGQQGPSSRPAAQREWNDDVEVAHTAPAPAPARTLSGNRQQGRLQPQRQPQEWNMDTDVNYSDAPRALPPTSPRATVGRAKTDTAGAAVAAQPNLSLLKSKIRRSSSGQNMNSLQTSSTSSYGTETDTGGYAAEQVASINRNGRRSAPNPSFLSNEEAPIRGGRGQASRPTPQAQYDQYQDGYGNQYDQEPPPRQARQAAPPKRAPADSRWDDHPQEQPVRGAAPRRNPADSRWDEAPPTEQPIRSAVQKRQDADSRWDDAPAQPQQPPARQQRHPPPKAAALDPFGPDAYPPGGIPEQAVDEGPQQQCPHCQRYFNPTPFEKHVKICFKVFQQKRKVFNSAQKRLDTDDPEMQKLAKEAAKLAAKQAAQEKRQAAMAERGGYAPPAQQQQQQQKVPPPQAAKFAPSAQVGGGGGGAKPSKPAPNGAGARGGGGGGGGREEEMVNGQPKWKAESNAFRDAMKAARMFAKAKAEGKPLPPPVASAPDPSLRPCPHCGRSFNEKAAERHIPQCQNIKAKPTALRRGAGGGGGLNGTATLGATAKGGKRGGFM